MIGKNVFDIQYKDKLNYIFPLNACDCDAKSDGEIAVFLYLYYEDQIQNYIEYVNNIPLDYDLFFISSQKSVLEAIKKCITTCRVAKYIVKENRGRDISALLIECAKYLDGYKYACFLHDKKAHFEELEEETDLWIKNLWGNLLGSEAYIYNIINLFNNNDNLGVIVPPPPIGNHFAIWQGFGWQGAFDVTKQLCDRLQLKANIDINKPPVAIGTALWFRTDALKRLFAYPWKYDDFDDTKLSDLNYLSYGVERIFPFVAQDAGYLTAEVMNTEYAAVQNGYLKYSLAHMFRNIYEYYPFPTMNQMELCEKNISDLLRLIEDKEDIYLYGAGRFGRFCLYALQQNLVKPKAFLVSEDVHEIIVDNLPVYSINELPDDECKSITAIITVEKRKTQNIIKELLQKKGISDVLIFWKDA